jgi:hypothetical protein
MNYKRGRLRFYKEYFLVLFPLFFVLHGYVSHFPDVPVWDALRVFGFYTLAIMTTAFLCWLLFKNLVKAALATFSVFCFQLFFGVLQDSVRLIPGLQFMGKYVVFVPLVLALLIAVLIFIKRSGSSFSKLTSYINLLLIAWIAIDAVQLIYKAALPDKQPLATIAQTNVCDTCTKPDIYFIIADEYAGTTVLKDVFSYNNAPFEDSLKKRGFHIVESSTSNYNFTPYSVASILNMNYVQGITVRSSEAQNRRTSYELIQTNKVSEVLKRHGYKIINYSVFDVAGQPTRVNTMFFKTRDKLITGQTFTERFQRDVEFNFVTRFKITSLVKKWVYNVQDINTTLYDRTYAEVTTNSNQPRFVYTHLFMPHYPYYFDENGKPAELKTLFEGEQVRQQEYVSYLKYCNNKFLLLADRILKESKTPPVIILMGDHGFRHFIEPVDKQYHFMNFNAVFLPGNNYEEFYKGMSGVNQFRIILNSMLNQQFTLLKDSTSFLLE